MLPAVQRLHLEHVEDLTGHVFALEGQRAGALRAGRHDLRCPAVRPQLRRRGRLPFRDELVILALIGQGGNRPVHDIRRLEERRHKAVHAAVSRRQVIHALLSAQKVAGLEDVRVLDGPELDAGLLPQVHRRLGNILGGHLRQDLRELGALVQDGGDIPGHLRPAEGRHRLVGGVQAFPPGHVLHPTVRHALLSGKEVCEVVQVLDQLPVLRHLLHALIELVDVLVHGGLGVFLGEHGLSVDPPILPKKLRLHLQRGGPQALRMVNGVRDLLRTVGLPQIPGHAPEPCDIVRVIEDVRQVGDVGFIALGNVVVRRAPLAALEEGVPPLPRLIVRRQATDGGRQLRRLRENAQRLQRVGELILRVRPLHVRGVPLDESDGVVAVGRQEIVDGIVEEIVLLGKGLHRRVDLRAVRLPALKELLVLRPPYQLPGQRQLVRAQAELPGGVLGVRAVPDVLCGVSDSPLGLHGRQLLPDEAVLHQLLHQRALLPGELALPAAAVLEGPHLVQHFPHPAGLVGLVPLDGVDVCLVDLLALLLPVDGAHDPLRGPLVHFQHGDRVVALLILKELPRHFLRPPADLRAPVLQAASFAVAGFGVVAVRHFLHHGTAHAGRDVLHAEIPVRDPSGELLLRVGGVQAGLRLPALSDRLLPGGIRSPQEVRVPVFAQVPGDVIQPQRLHGRAGVLDIHSLLRYCSSGGDSASGISALAAPGLEGRCPLHRNIPRLPILDSIRPLCYATISRHRRLRPGVAIGGKAGLIGAFSRCKT